MNRLVVVVASLIIVVGVIALLLFPMNNERERKVALPALAPQQPAPALPAPEIENKTIVCKGTARCFTATVKGVIDGDTLDIGDLRIRLALVNTPERGELGYSEATKFAGFVCPVGAGALVDEDDGQREGSLGRMVALVYCNGKNLNAELLDKGHASILTRFCSVSEFAREIWVKKACG